MKRTTKKTERRNTREEMHRKFGGFIYDNDFSGYEPRTMSDIALGMRKERFVYGFMLNENY